jgi:hypothetical protein
MPRQEELELEVLRNMMRSGGLNLAGQSIATDPTYRSGFDYARSIAGGMPFEDVVAPGMSFSPDQPMGYTQRDLTKERIYGDFDGTMPVAPTKGTPVEASYETMPYAPVGTPMPTPFIPGQTTFPGIPDFLKDLDFSFLENLDFSGLPGVKKDTEEIVEPQQDFFKVDQNLFNFEEIADKIDMDEVAKIDIEKIDIPESVSLFSDILKEPVSEEPTLPSIFDQPTAPVMPTIPMKPMVQPINEPVIPAQTLPQPIFENIPKPQPLPMPVMPQVPVMPKPIAPVPQAPMQIPNLPMNLTGLPQIPVMPEPIERLPVIPKIPVMPQITYTPPVPSFVQPQIEDIVSPIRAGSLRNFQQPGLFNLV